MRKKMNIMIEHITEEKLKDLEDWDLRDLRHRFINLFNNYFHDSTVMKASGIPRRTFMEKYILLREEMNNRGIKFFRTMPLETEIEKRIFKSFAWDLDVYALKDLLMVPNYISIGGDYIISPKSVEKVDVIIRHSEEHRNDKFEAVISQIIKEQTRKETNFIYNINGPDSSYVPLFDLMLKSHEEIKKIKIVKKVKKKEVTIKKPEETDDTIRIPVGPDCEVTATITIDKGQGIQALYCGKIKKVRTFLFDKRVKAWTMASARAWIKEQKEKTEKVLGEGRGIGGPRQGVGGTDICICPECGHELKHKRNVPCADIKCPKCGKPMAGKEEKQTIFKIIKVDKAQRILGGVIYEPDEVDTQGDFTDAKEIEKAMYRFMEKYATDTKRIKINHKGKRYHFPIMEVFQAEEDTVKGGQTLKKGTWWLEIKVTNDTIWKMAEKNEIEAFSMGGHSKAKA